MFPANFGYVAARSVDDALQLLAKHGEEGKLLAKLGQQPKFPIFAESETLFFYKVVDAQLEFVKNDKGEITGLVLHQNGRDTKGVKK